MNTGIFLNMAALYPVAELHFAQKDKLKKNAHAYQCFGELKYCHINPFGRRAICNYCIYRANSVTQKLEIKVIPIEKKISSIKHNSLIAQIETSVMSSIASLTRISGREELSDPWVEVHHNLLESSKSIYTFFENEFKYNLSELLMFNGRFCWDASARFAAISLKKNYVVYDFKKTNSYYEFHNTSLHSINANYSKAIKFYLENPSEARKVARDFIDSKIAGLPTYEKSYTELQQNNKISIKLDKHKKIISIFPSSDDEYKYIGNEWGAEIIKSQPEEIREFITEIDNKNYQIVIRMHPNMRGLSKTTLNSYLILEKTFLNVSVLKPEDVSSTYTLIDKSDYVVCFCSTVATEANYKGKKVICIGGSPYCSLRIANYVKNGRNAAIKIMTNNVKIGVKRASIIWFYYLWKYCDNNKYILKHINKSNQISFPFTFVIDKPYILRLLQSPYRAEIELRKPSNKNYDYYKRFCKSILDIIFNKFSIKL